MKLTYFIGALFLVMTSLSTASESEQAWLSKYYQCLHQLNWQHAMDHLPLAPTLAKIKKRIAKGEYGNLKDPYANVAKFFEHAKVLWVPYEESMVVLFVSDAGVLPVLLDKKSLAQIVVVRRLFSKPVAEEVHRVVLTEDTYALPAVFLEIHIEDAGVNGGRRIGKIGTFNVGAPPKGLGASDFVTQPLYASQDVQFKNLVGYGVVDAIVGTHEFVKAQTPMALAAIGFVPSTTQQGKSKTQVINALGACRTAFNENDPVDKEIVSAIDQELIAIEVQ